MRTLATNYKEDAERTTCMILNDARNVPISEKACYDTVSKLHILLQRSNVLAMFSLLFAFICCNFKQDVKRGFAINENRGKNTNSSGGSVVLLDNGSTKIGQIPKIGLPSSSCVFCQSPNYNI